MAEERREQVFERAARVRVRPCPVERERPEVELIEDTTRARLPFGLVLERDAQRADAVEDGAQDEIEPRREAGDRLRPREGRRERHVGCGEVSKATEGDGAFYIALQAWRVDRDPVRLRGFANLAVLAEP